MSSGVAKASASVAKASEVPPEKQPKTKTFTWDPPNPISFPPSELWRQDAHPLRQQFLK